jgi:hypothetical protein
MPRSRMPFVRRIFYVDIDNTICRTSGLDYENAIPIHQRIAVVNKLCQNGHGVVYWTARGHGTNQDLCDLTRRQLKYWGCDYNQLSFNKPIFDYLIDDRSCSPSALTDTRRMPALLRGQFSLKTIIEGL